MQKNVTVFMTPQRLRRFICAKRTAGDVRKTGISARQALSVKGQRGCAAGIAPTIRRFCNAITQIQIAEWYRCGISQRRTKILFADGNTKCGGKRASSRTEKYAQTPLLRVVRLRPLRQNGENIKGRAGVYLEKRSKRGGFASYCRLRLFAKVIDNVSFSCYNGLIARRMTSAPIGFPCACSARAKAHVRFFGREGKPIGKTIRRASCPRQAHKWRGIEAVITRRS